ncbi:MAG: flagellar assembly protein FliW [Spirochaetes bacterium]|nr:flagellar assembly protein FliW [Spirochaetota bacterium]
MTKDIKTKQFGMLTIDEETLFSFPDGLFGFENLKKFTIVEEADSPMMWLQSCNEPDLAFVILRVLDFMKEYDLSISQGDLEAVLVDDPSKLEVFAIITIPLDNPSDMTANLMGPIIINMKKRIGRQVISLSDKYKTKHCVLDELQAKTGA